MAENFFRVSFHNVGSLGTNHDDFISLFTDKKIDIMAVNETWLRPGEEGRAPLVPGYRLRHVPRPVAVRSGRGGGVGFYIKRDLNVRIWSYPVDPRYEQVEQMWLTFKLNGKKIALGTAYRPPWLDLDLFLDALTDAMSTLSDCDNFVLVGDFNVDMFRTSEIKARKITDFLVYLELKQLVCSATHHTDSSATLIDLVCTDLRTRNVWVEAFKSVNSHSVVHCELNIKRDEFQPFILRYRPIKYINRKSFTSDLLSLNWKGFSTIQSIDEMVEVFNLNILSIFDLHAPIKKCYIKDPVYPWITNTIQFMMKLRDKALSSYRKSKLESKKTVL